MTDYSINARSRLLAAFNRLLLQRKKGRPQLREVIAEARVARSTLYDHFNGRDDLLLEAFKGPLSILTSAGQEGAEQERIASLLVHLRDRRQDANDFMNGSLRARVTRTLSDLLQEHDDTLSRNSALQLSEILLGFIRLWLAGETAFTPERLAKMIDDSMRAQRKVFSEGDPKESRNVGN